MQRNTLKDWVGGATIASILCCAMGGPSWSAVGGAVTNETIYTNSTLTVNNNTNVTAPTIQTYETSVLGVDTAYYGGVKALDETIDGVAKATSVVFPSQNFTSSPSSQEVLTALANANTAVYNDLDTFAQQAGRDQETIDKYNEIQIVTSDTAGSTSSTSTSTQLTSSTTTNVITTTTGPGTILIGDNQGTSFTLAGGQTDINVEALTTDNNTITTTTTTNTKTAYTVTGNLFISPIVLNLNGTGKLEASDGQWMPHPHQFSMTHHVLFDFHGNGFPVAMEWVGPHDGLLCRPKPDGSVDGTCLFGTSTGFANGYENMASLDENLDGRLSGKELKGLYVWQDTNGDGRAQASELKTVAELGITELNIKNQNFKGTFTMKGKSCTMYDWWPNTMEIKKIKRSV